ncbi:hypothetical protein Bbelb_170170 [Branchiostoma belcheri]|nr:hypothetical protein Bbelb_170170 [Branchiostoma belcheri]
MGSGPSSQKSQPPTLLPIQVVHNLENERFKNGSLEPLQPQAVQNTANEQLEDDTHTSTYVEQVPIQAVQNTANEQLVVDDTHTNTHLDLMPIQAVQNNRNEKIPIRSQAVQNSQNERLQIRPQAVQNSQNERLQIRPQAVQNSQNERLQIRPQAVQNSQNERLQIRPQAVQNNRNEQREKGSTKKQGGQKDLKRLESSSEFGQDVMISYSHQDMDFMRKMRGSLESAGISVWVDEQGLGAGVDFLNKIGHAIVEAKVFLSLLSPNSVTSKYCKDELALAYISNKPIFPVAMATRDGLRKGMDFGMQLTLAPMEWVDFSDRDKFDVSFAALTQKIKAATNDGDESKVAEVTRPKLERTPTRQNLNKMTRLNSNPLDDESDFWERAFKDAKDVPWSKFKEAFDKQYGSLLDGMQISSDAENKDWLMTVLKREMNVENNIRPRIFRIRHPWSGTLCQNSQGQCGNHCKKQEEPVKTLLVPGGVRTHNLPKFRFMGGVKLPFWQRVHEQAVESYTMREVFQMESSVRLSAIEDLAKYRSKAVVDALLDLLQDEDPNVRAVAAVTLAKSGNAEDQQVINRLLKTLQDKDRLVRESGCIALGHLRVRQAVPQLVHLWRNDTISTVREAASVSLEKIGGEEAEKAIHMTKVLSEEIKLLMTQSMQKQDRDKR